MPIQISQGLPAIASSAADALNRDLPLSKFVGQNVQLIFSPAFQGLSDAGMGTLYITTRNIIFQSENECITIDYPTIVIHAISRGENDRLVGKPCIYCQLEHSDGSDVVPEMRIVPNDDGCLDELFIALNECAALNPDPRDDQASDELEEPFQGVSLNGLSNEGMRNLQYLDNLLKESLESHSDEAEEVIDHAQDWLIKMNPIASIGKDKFNCPIFFQGLSRFKYNEKVLEFSPTRPANRRKKQHAKGNTNADLESSQKVILFKAIRNKQPSVLLCWDINGKHAYYLFDHKQMKSIDIKKTQTRPALSIDLSFLSFEIFKGPHIPTKAVLLDLKNCITDVNDWLQSQPVKDHLINSVSGVLVREACLERQVCFTNLESDIMKYDENWKLFISKTRQTEDIALDEIAKAYNLISSQSIRLYHSKAIEYEIEHQVEWDKGLYEIIHENPEISDNEQVWIVQLEKLKLNHSIQAFRKYLLK